MIRYAIKALSDYHDELSSKIGVFSLYDKSGFNKEAKYGMFRKAATVEKPLADLVIIKKPRGFSDLKYKIVD